MAATRLGKALDQGFGLRVQVEEAHAPAGRAHPRERVGQVGQAGRGLDVERDGDAIATRRVQVARGFGDERQREIVDRVIARVLERRQRDALSRAGDTADQQQIHLGLSPDNSRCRRVRSDRRQPPSSISFVWRSMNSFGAVDAALVDMKSRRPPRARRGRGPPPRESSPCARERRGIPGTSR